MSIECIRDQNSISFDTSTGQWTGVLTWTEIPWAQGSPGVGKIILSAGETQTITLGGGAIKLYPGVDPEQTRSFSCGINVAFELPATQLTMKVNATCGGQSYEGFLYSSYSAQHWEFPGTHGDLPKGLGEEEPTMELLLWNQTADPVTVYVDEAHFNEEFGPVPPQPPKIRQYLPIMGIG